jgi:gliding motility-associated lipoprotein GldH
VKLEKDSWHKDSLVRFKLKPGLSKTGKGNILFRYTKDYPFYNLNFRYGVATIDTNGLPLAILSRDTLNINLFHPRNGVPFGEEARPTGKGIGKIFEQRIPFTLTTDNQNTTQIDIQHYMRPPALSGIVSVGIEMD